MDELTRREFVRISLGTAGIAAGVLGLEGCNVTSRKDLFSIEKPPVPGSQFWMKGEEKVIATSCCQCPVGCGIHARVVEARAVKIEGNTASPINQGGVGPKGQSGLEVLYDPDRIQHPLKRAGERGSGQWKEISWDEALQEVAKELNGLRSGGNSHQLAVICGRPRGQMVDLWKRFCAVYGTPNFYDSFSFSGSDGPMKEAMQLMMGGSDLPAYDWNNTMYVLSLGAALFEASCQGIYFARLAALMRHRNKLKRVSLVQVETVNSLTAQKSDEWIPVQPGTYDALALSISHVLVMEKLYDQKFVQQHTFGFEAWKDSEGNRHPGFREILEDYSPEKISSVVGIPAETIARLAHEMAENRPSVAVIDARSTGSSNGLEIARASLALNALLGSINCPGGLLVQQSIPLAPWPSPKLDKVSKKGTEYSKVDTGGTGEFPLSSSTVEAIPEKILSGKPYPIQALFLYYANPLFSRVYPERFKKAFDKIPFVVSFSPFMDESAYFSDLILPDCTYLERWEDATPAPAVGYPVLGVRQPVVEPLYTTMNTGDAVIKLAQSMGEPFSGSFPWKNFQEATGKRIAELAKIKGGSVSGSDEEDFLKSLSKVGYWEHPSSPYLSFDKIFASPSKKFEFYSQSAKSMLENQAKHNGITVAGMLKNLDEANLDSACLPEAKAAQWEGTLASFPLYFLPYKPVSYAEGSGANLPWLHEIGKLQNMTSWDSWVELNPVTAMKRGISQGDYVWIVSPVAQIRTHAVISGNIPENVASMPLGMGHTQMGRFAQGRGENAREILVAKINRLTGIMPVWGTRVEVKRV